MEFWIYAGPIAVAVVGWFLASEISRLRKQLDKISENQTQMAITLGKLETEIKTKL